jgi:cytidylate kinase
VAVITFSRQYGSGGDDIAAQVCERLNYHYFDKNLMLRVAAEVGLSEHEVIDFSEERYEVRSFLSRLFRASGPVARVSIRQRDAEGREMLTEHALDADACIELVRHSVIGAYKQGDMVIVGRGGQAILQRQPDVFHVRVIAPLDVRMDRLRAQGVTGVSDIKTTIDQKDRTTADYLKRFHGIDVDDLTHYHVVINTGKMHTDAAVELIVTAVQRMEAQPVS